MRALSIQPPWSLAIARLGKQVENRTWPTKYRGTIAIHSSLKWDPAGENSRIVQDTWALYTATNLPPNNAHVGPLRRTSLWMDYGAIIAVAELTGCHRHGDPSAPCDAGGWLICSPWAAHGQWHWVLSDVRRLREPVPTKGALGLWSLPDDVEALVAAQLIKERAS